MAACESQLEGLLSQGLERALALPCPAATLHALQGFAAIGNPSTAEQVTFAEWSCSRLCSARARCTACK